MGFNVGSFNVAIKSIDFNDTNKPKLQDFLVGINDGLRVGSSIGNFSLSMLQVEYRADQRI